MILHTVKTSPLQTLALYNCLQLVAQQDSLLLIEDAVVASQAANCCSEKLLQLAQEGRLMVLEADLAARGITPIMGKKCSYLDFVELAIKHQSQLAW